VDRGAGGGGSTGDESKRLHVGEEVIDDRLLLSLEIEGVHDKTYERKRK